MDKVKMDWSMEDIARKVNELVEGYNELRENYLDLSKLFYIHLGGKEKSKDSVAIQEGLRKKGGLNSKPSTPRPAPPKGQK